MNRSEAAALGLACAVLLAGCASSEAGIGGSPRAVEMSSAGPMTPGMTMPDGSVMADGTGSASASDEGSAPSASTQMICSEEIRSEVSQILDMPSAPVTRATWLDDLYTCTYLLPFGELVVSVKQSPDPAATKLYYEAQRSHRGQTTDAYGLGSDAFATPSGIVSLIKDNSTLTVDATALPAVFGTQQQQRNDFAYEIASVILGCWTGD